MFIIIARCSKSVYIEFEPEVSILGQLFLHIMCVTKVSNSTFNGLLFFPSRKKLSRKNCLICRFSCFSGDRKLQTFDSIICLVLYPHFRIFVYEPRRSVQYVDVLRLF